MKKIIVLIILMGSIFPVYAQWEWQNPKPQGYDLRGVHFINENNGWAVGGFGTIIYTSDGGTNWDMQLGYGQVMLPYQKNRIYNWGFYDVFFTDTTNGWVVGYGCIYHTSDGGETWLEQVPDSNRPGAPIYSGVYFLDPYNGWVVGTHEIWNDINYLLHTKDGGETWEEQVMETTTGSLRDIYFIDMENGWIVGDHGTILQTSDGGLTWNTIPTGTTETLNDIFFADTQHGWVVGKGGTIFKSDNGGQSWNQPAAGNFMYNFNSVTFPDTNNGWAVGESVDGFASGEIICTHDGGETWVDQLSEPLCKSLGKVTFSDPTHGWAVGLNGAILHTDDSGESWHCQSSIVTTGDLWDVSFTDVNHGWAAGGYNASDPEQGPIICFTGNGGKSWDNYDIGLSGIERINSVCFVDSLNGWAVGIGTDGDVVIHSEDGGQNWSTQFLDISGLQKVYFTDAQHGWVVGLSGLIYYTQNGGNTWDPQSSGTNRSLLTLTFIDQNTGWIGGAGIILHTTNCGFTWNTQWIGGEASNIGDICFIDHENGWVANGTLMYTIDGGLSWTEMNNLPGWSVLHVYFTDPSNGWICGSSSPGINVTTLVSYTGDGGNTWEIQFDADIYLSRVFFVDPENGWVVGERGTILYSNNQGMVGETEPFSQIQHSALSIQNYPNPFTECTTITYNIPICRFVTLKVFDLSGREIESLASGILSQGTYTQSFNASKLESGIYILSLRAGDAVVTQKLIVIR